MISPGEIIAWIVVGLLVYVCAASLIRDAKSGHSCAGCSGSCSGSCSGCGKGCHESLPAEEIRKRLHKALQEKQN